MAFVRMILPAWIAGLYAGLLLLLLVFFFNPHLPLTLATVGPLLPAWLVGAAPAAVGWPLGYRFVRLFARRRLRVRWLSTKYLIGFTAAELVVVSAVYWFNANLLESVIPPSTVLRVRGAAILITLVALGFVIAISAPRLRGRSDIHLACLLAAAGLPIGLTEIRSEDHPAPPPPYTAELIRPAPSSPRLLILGWEGATLDQILPLVAQGKLPGLARLLQRGAHGRLTPFRPCVSAVSWQSLLTGKLPYKHGLGDDFRISLGPIAGDIRVIPRGLGLRRLANLTSLPLRPQTADESRALTILQILDRLGFPSRRVTAASPDAARPPDLPDSRIDRFLDPEILTPPGTAPLAQALREALAEDQAVAAAALGLWREGKARMVLVETPGLEEVSRLFLRYAMPGGFGDVPASEVEKYGPVLERYYRYLDEWIGKFLDPPATGATPASPPESVLIVLLSPHGNEPLPLFRRALAWLEGNRFESGYHGRAPDGLLVAAGPGIRHGAPLQKASILDLAPTLLYRYGLPIGLDMDGRPLTRLFEDSFIAENSVLLIPSYEASRLGFPPERVRSAVVP